ncbi:MAG: neutral zinc metallopeptidase [Actinobacteria bacterium]|nr:neutral zinc metallopeptidase [Actinomycetota bacterium]
MSGRRRRGRLSVALVIATLVLVGCSGHKLAGAHPSDRTTASLSASASPAITDGPAGKLPQFPAPPATPDLPPAGAVSDVSQFITAVFSDAQQDWQKVFTTAGTTYTPARLLIFSAQVNTACGAQTSQVGPFYCPGDRTVYLDLSFFDEMERNYGLKGDFAMAFVVAHEVGHHIQFITGLTAQVQRASTSYPAQANALSIRTELQADCYAGVWAHSTYTRGLLEPGDLDEALAAAATVGDDFLQKSATGTVNPEQWTHGTSAQRQQWLTTGYDSGRPSACDTFTSV